MPLPKNLFRIFVASLNELKRNDPLRLAGATAFFTTFALPPMFIILIKFFGLLMNEEKLGKEMFHALSETVGPVGSTTIQRIFVGMKGLAINWFIAIGGFLFLMFVATTLFKVLKDSVNQLWEIRLANSRSFSTQLSSRFRALMIVALVGILFFASLLADGVQSIISHSLHDTSYNVAGALIVSINKVISILITTTWFMLLFRYLPDGIVTWRVAAMGGLVTAALFTLGKIVLRVALPYESLSSVFGASGSFVLLLLFVFYSSFIFYYGACFTKHYALYSGHAIQPRENAFVYEVTEKEGNTNVQ